MTAAEPSGGGRISMEKVKGEFAPNVRTAKAPGCKQLLQSYEGPQTMRKILLRFSIMLLLLCIATWSSRMDEIVVVFLASC